MKRRSGEAQAALGRRAPVMKHRLTPRGGSKNNVADVLAEHGLEQPYDDSDTFEESPVKHTCERISSFDAVDGQYPTCDKPAKWAFHYRYPATKEDYELAKLAGYLESGTDHVGVTYLCDECAREEPDLTKNNMHGNIEPNWLRPV
jgi:hypothetical protein